MLDWITCVNCTHTVQVHQGVHCDAYHCDCSQLVTEEVST